LPALEANASPALGERLVEAGPTPGGSVQLGLPAFAALRYNL